MSRSKSTNHSYKGTLLQVQNTTQYEPRTVFQTKFTNPSLTAITYPQRGHIIHYPVNGTGRDTYIHNN